LLIVFVKSGDQFIFILPGTDSLKYEKVKLMTKTSFFAFEDFIPADFQQFSTYRIQPNNWKNYELDKQLKVEKLKLINQN